jgi:hypothetical protein
MRFSRRPSPSKRFKVLSLEEIAAVVRWLCSDAVALVVGTRWSSKAAMV